MHIRVEQLPAWLIARYRHVHEPLEPRRPRLGHLSEREQEEAVRASLRPHTGNVDASTRRMPAVLLRKVERKLKDRKWIELREGDKP